MTFQPILPATGVAGWQFVQRTLDQQQSVFGTTGLIQRETEYFLEKIGSVTSAEDLVADRTLRKVALGAFGLQEDIDNIYFVRKVLEDGFTDSEALANRLTDKRYLALATAFNFESGAISSFSDPASAEGIIEQYRTQEFEIAVGNSDPNIRLALGFARELQSIIDRGLSDDGAWFAAMGTEPVRVVFERALGLPTSFGTLDLDQQLKTFRERTESRFGISEIADMAGDEFQEELVRSFLLQSEFGPTGFTQPGSTALILLSNATQPL